MPGIDKTAVRVIRLTDPQSDFAYWQSQPVERRLEALEAIRREYDDWKYGPEQRFQRVYRVIKRP